MVFLFVRTGRTPCYVAGWTKGSLLVAKVYLIPILLFVSPFLIVFSCLSAYWFLSNFRELPPFRGYSLLLRTGEHFTYRALFLALEGQHGVHRDQKSVFNENEPNLSTSIKPRGGNQQYRVDFDLINQSGEWSNRHKLSISLCLALTLYPMSTSFLDWPMTHRCNKSNHQRSDPPGASWLVWARPWNFS